MHFGYKLREFKQQLGDVHHPKNIGMPRGHILIEAQFAMELVGHFDREGHALREIAAKVCAMSDPTDISVMDTIEKLMVDAARYRAIVKSEELAQKVTNMVGWSRNLEDIGHMVDGFKVKV